MGGICSGNHKQVENPIERMLKRSNMNLLLDQWPASFILLLKQKFQAVAQIDEYTNRNKKGKEGLDYKGFKKLFPKLKDQPNEISLRTFNSFDLDGSGMIDFREFCFVLSLIINSDESQRTYFIFQLYDRDNDQAMSREEFKYFLKSNIPFILIDSLIKAWGQVKQVQDKNMIVNRIVTEVFQNNKKIKLDVFQEWIDKYFDTIKYFEIFELVPSPMKEREIIRQIMKSEDKTLTEKKYYVISYKWWELWRFYINYNYAQKLKDMIQVENNIEEIPLQVARQSRRGSNVSLVDLNLGHSIPSEMKEDHSITRKIHKSNMLPLDVPFNQACNVVMPGQMMQEAKSTRNIIIQRQLDQQDKQSPIFKVSEHQNNHKHSNSSPNPNLANFQIQQDELLLQNDRLHPFYNNLQQMMHKPADDDPDPLVSYAEQQQPNFDMPIKANETSQGMQGSIRLYELDPPQMPQQQCPPSPMDTLQNPAVDYQNFKYGLCDTEENEWNQGRLVAQSEGNQYLRPGQIDNSDLQGEFQGELKLNLLNNHDYILIPEQAWMSLIQWYGCISPHMVFKRQVFQNPKRNANILDLYPPVIRGYVATSKGEIDYSSKVILMVSARKKLKDCFLKFKKKLKLDKPQAYVIFFKKIGEMWTEAPNLDQTLMEYRIDSGSFIIFVPKKLVNYFRVQHCSPPRLKMFENFGSNKQEIPVRLGDQYDVLHPLTNEWLACHVCDINPDGVRFHIRKESFQKEFTVEYDQLISRIQPITAKSKVIESPLQIRNQNFNNLSTKFLGISNLGNTCFINTVLQCLMYTPLFRQYLLNHTYKDDFQQQKIRQGFNHNNLSNTGKAQQQNIYLIEEFANLVNQPEKEKDKSPQIYKQFSLIPSDFKKAIDIILPQFSGYEQHDAQEFLSIFLDTISDELKRNNHPSDQVGGETFESVIKELFTGKTVNQLQCQTCQNTSSRFEDYYTLSLPLPISDEVNFEVVFVRRCSKSVIPPLIKYGIKVSKYGTLKDFITAFEKVSGVPHTRFEFAEIYRNNIHKQFYNHDTKTSIRHLGMKPYDEIYAFEILRLPKDIDEEANELMQLTPLKKSFLIGDFVDVSDQQGEWRHGQIQDIRDRPNDKIYYRVVIKYDKSEMIVRAQLQNNEITQFRTKVPSKKTAVLANIVHRIYNPVSDTIEKFAIPMMQTVPLWLTWKEFRVQIYSQAKRFIDFAYVKKKQYQTKHLKENKHLFQSPDNEKIVHIYMEDEQLIQNRVNQQAQSVYLGYDQTILIDNNIIREAQAYPQSNKNSGQKQSQQQEYMSFHPRVTLLDVHTPRATQQNRERGFSSGVIHDEIAFLSSSDFPYKLRLIDPVTYCCSTCEKPITYNPQKQKMDKYCKGCEWGMEDAPLSLNIPTSFNLTIALDWIDSLAFNPLSTQLDHDESYELLKQEKKERRDRISMEQCFDIFTEEEKLDIQCDHCNSLQPARAKFSLGSMPNILVLHLKRFQYRDGYLEKIDNDIQFPLKNLNLKKWMCLNFDNTNGKHQDKDKMYDLYAVANHQGNGQEGHYTSYVQVQHEGKDVWVCFDDEHVRLVSEERIMSQYTYLLFYKRKEFSSSAIINLTFKSFDKGQYK